MFLENSVTLEKCLGASLHGDPEWEVPRNNDQSDTKRLVSDQGLLIIILPNNLIFKIFDVLDDQL